ncbi:MAG: hypothetical protein U1B77_03055 [Dehalococcoidales bacterium]|nr:hypothetical protein [Dehalococcoidales bacterium]
MDMLLRVIAIIVEVSILVAIFYALLNGVRLIIFDFGLREKYRRMVNMALMIVGVIVTVFFISHLTLLYPTIGAG